MINAIPEDKESTLSHSSSLDSGASRILVAAAVGVLLLLLVVQAVLSMRQKSITVDEMVYITSGYYHLKTGDFLYNMTNPPLIKMISALPLLAVDPALPEMGSDPFEWDQIQQWQYARSFLFDNRVDADSILFLSRVPIVLLSVILGLFVFAWSKELYGAAAGLFALFLFSFSPTVLAYSRLATQDLGVAAFSFIGVFFFWKYSQQGKGLFLILTGILFGLSILAKITTVIVLPTYGLYGVMMIAMGRARFANFKLPLLKYVGADRRWLRQLLALTIILIVISILGFVVVHIGYGFQGSFRPIDPTYFGDILERLASGSGTRSRLMSSLLALPLPIPLPFARSLFFQLGNVSSFGNVYFAGEIYQDGLWYIMPAAFFLKTPLPTIILLGMALIFFAVKRDKLDAEWLILVAIGATILLYIAFNSTVTGVRYILPIYPFIFVLISSLLTVRIDRQSVLSGFIVLMSLWYLFSAVTIYPDYLAYFNEIIGGPENGYKYLADSNVDWGQDLKALKIYMEEQGIDKIKLAYFGSADANYYGIDYEYLPSVGLAPKEPIQYWWYEIDSDEKKRLDPQTGTIAVSVNIHNSPSWMHGLFAESYAWLNDYEPVDQVGHSILIYEID